MGMLPDNSESRDKLKEEIKKLEAVRTGVEKPTLAETKLKELDYTPPTDEYLAEKAETSLADYKVRGESDIRRASEENAQTLRTNKAEYEAARVKALESLEKAYGNAAERVDSDVIKRGLARSSVAVNAKSGLADDYASRSAEILGEYGSKIADIDAEINSVGSKLTAALDDFNIAYAAKLAEKLDSLKADREKKSKEAVEFNNSVREKQAKLDADRLKTESALYSSALSQYKTETSLDSLTPEARDAVYKSVFSKMDAYLGGMTEQQAKLEFLNHSLYRDHLSDYYYYKLYDKYGR